MALRTSTQVMSEIRTVAGSGAVSGRLTMTSASTTPASAVMASFAFDGLCTRYASTRATAKYVIPLSGRDAFNTLNASLRARNSGLRNHPAPAQNLRLHEVLHIRDRGAVQRQQAEPG